MTGSLTIEYYTDMLCVWAWIAERRNAELEREWGDRVQLDDHFLDLFSDTATRIGQGWLNKGGYSAFGDHVRDSAGQYLEESVHRDIWSRVRPTTSANAHLVIHAVRLIHDSLTATQLASSLRRAFFVDARDISQLAVLYELAQEHNVATSDIRAVIQSGNALAGVMSDLRLAHEKRIAGSPTWVLNDGRQVLYGNVGYRVLQANVEELIKRPAHEASWC